MPERSGALRTRAALGPARTAWRTGGTGCAVLVGLVVVLSRLPSFVVAAIMWSATRVPALRRLGALGAREPLALIDVMEAMAPGQIPTLRALRPAP